MCCTCTNVYKNVVLQNLLVIGKNAFKEFNFVLEKCIHESIAFIFKEYGMRM